MTSQDHLNFKVQVCPAASRCASHHYHLSVIHDTPLNSQECIELTNRSAMHLRTRCLGPGAPLCSDFIKRDK